MIRIKRESGENPGQSRCCEAPFQHPENYFCHWLMVINREGFGMGVSQKTCRSLKAIVSNFINSKKMEKLCLCCGTKFSGNIDLLSGDFAATYFSIHK